MYTERLTGVSLSCISVLLSRTYVRVATSQYGRENRPSDRRSQRQRLGVDVSTR